MRENVGMLAYVGRGHVTHTEVTTASLPPRFIHVSCGCLGSAFCQVVDPQTAYILRWSCAVPAQVPRLFLGIDSSGCGASWEGEQLAAAPAVGCGSAHLL